VPVGPKERFFSSSGQQRLGGAIKEEQSKPSMGDIVEIG
jgi:hypothetical protein